MNTTKPYIFIHIPKTGGSSISNTLNLYGHCCHEPISKYPRYLTEKVFTFAFVRNPFDRILSAYNYLKYGYGNTGDIEWAQSNLSRFNHFNEFVKEFKTDEGLQSCLHFRSVFSFIDQPLDFIGRYENIDADFNVVCDKIGLYDRQLECINTSSHEHYSTYYDEQSVSIIEKMFSRELEEFQYKFDNF